MANEVLTYRLDNDLGGYVVTGYTSLGNGSVTIPQKYENKPVVSIDEEAFLGSTITSITIGNNIVSIGVKAFSGCSTLKTVTIGNSVTSIGDYAFSGCSSLKSIAVDADNTAYKSIDGNLYSKDGKTLIQYAGGKENTSFATPDGVTSIGTRAFAFCQNLTSVTISNDVTSIGEDAFNDCLYLTSVTISTSVTIIDGGVFVGCLNLTEITIPDSITSIGDLAFWRCSKLTSVTIPDSVTSIGYKAFQDCSGLTSVTIGNGVTSIGEGAFNNCSNLEYNVYDNTYYLGNEQNPYLVLVKAKNTSVSSVSIHNDTKIVADNAFYNCESLASVTIGNNVTNIGYQVFTNCSSLTRVYITDIAKWCAISFGNSYSNPLYYAKNLYLNGKLVTELVIPNSVGNIGSDTFQNCTSLKSVTISDSVASIDQSAFVGCSNLESVIIGNGVTSIGAYAFKNCTNLTSITIPNSIMSIGEQAFSGCNIQTATIPIEAISTISKANLKTIVINGGNEIGQSAFSGCTGLTNVTISDSITSIGQYAFQGCTGLTSMTIPDSVRSIDQSAFVGCSGLASVIIDNGVTSIGDYAFKGCTSLTSVTIPDSVTSIGSEVFAGCTILAEATIGNSVTSIGNSAFEGCSGLISVTIGNGVTNIGSEVFAGCTALEEINIPDSVTNIGSQVFAGCTNLAKVTIGNSMENISEAAFSGCSELADVDIPDGVTSISASAFSGCISLTSITIPDSVTEIGGSAFSGCSSLESITLPFVGGSATATSASSSTLFGYIFGTSPYKGGGGTKTTQEYASGSSITYYIPTLLKSVTITGGKLFYGAFHNCTNLTSVTIPGSVTDIGDKAFDNCSSLTSITIPDSVESIGQFAFMQCQNLTSINIPNSVTNIGKSAFSSCWNLTSINIPNSVINIGEEAFLECTNLKSAIIGNGVTSIGDNTFCSCGKLASVTIGNSVKSIGEQAFSDCHSLESVTIPDSVTSIGKNAFGGCSGLTSITIGNSVTNIGEQAFANCKNITRLTIGDSVTSIGKNAFVGCDNIQIATIPTGAISAISKANLKTIVINGGDVIGSRAFKDCGNLTSVTIGSSITSIGGSAFSGCTTLSRINFNATTMTDLSSNNNVFYNAGESGDGITVVIGKGVTEIPAYLFCPSSDALKITNVEFEERSVCESIGGNAFRNCTDLTSINIPDSVTDIGSGAFAGCTDLKEITISDSVTDIGGEAFLGCTGLTKVIIPDSVTTIGSSAFGGDSSTPEIYTDWKSKPDGWQSDWNQGGSVTWGYRSYICDLDFLGFTYNGKHSFYDMNVLRATAKGLSESNITPTLAEKTAEVPGGDGIYYFGTYHRQREFSINFAFDHLTEEQFLEWKRLCNGKELADLIFDEEPYKVYTAKPSGTSVIKYICFDEISETGAKERIYKGEGTITFTCYWPYAHTPREDTKISEKIRESGVFGKDGKLLGSYLKSQYPTKDLWSEASGLPSLVEAGKIENKGDIPAPFVLSIPALTSGTHSLQVGDCQITITGAYDEVKWDSKTGLVSAKVGEKRIPIPYSGESLGAIPVGGIDVKQPSEATLTYDYWYY